MPQLVWCRWEYERCLGKIYKETLALSGGPKRQKDDCCCVGGRMSIFPRKAPPAGGPGALLMTASNYGSALIRASIPNPRVTATRGLTNWGAREARGTRETSAHHAWRHLGRAVHISRPASVALSDPLALQLWNPLSSSPGRSQQNQFWLVEQKIQRRPLWVFFFCKIFLQKSAINTDQKQACLMIILLFVCHHAKMASSMIKPLYTKLSSHTWPDQIRLKKVLLASQTFTQFTPDLVLNYVYFLSGLRELKTRFQKVW